MLTSPRTVGPSDTSTCGAAADLVVRGLFFLGRFAGGRWQRLRV